MTWQGLCPECRGNRFILTVNNATTIHVNCANPECSTYIGFITPATTLHTPLQEPH